MENNDYTKKLTDEELENIAGGNSVTVPEMDEARDDRRRWKELAMKDLRGIIVRINSSYACMNCATIDSVYAMMSTINSVSGTRYNNCKCYACDTEYSTITS